eukprot:365162-Chlamydomonas_euryale.AAC.12
MESRAVGSGGVRLVAAPCLLCAYPFVILTCTSDSDSDHQLVFLLNQLSRDDSVDHRQQYRRKSKISWSFEERTQLGYAHVRRGRQWGISLHERRRRKINAMPSAPVLPHTNPAQPAKRWASGKANVQ